MEEQSFEEIIRAFIKEAGMSDYVTAKKLENTMNEINQQVTVGLMSAKALMDSWAPGKPGPKGEIPEAYASEVFKKLSQIVAMHAMLVGQGVTDIKNTLTPDQRLQFGFGPEE
jgi:hypothetical protein